MLRYFTGRSTSTDPNMTCARDKRVQKGAVQKHLRRDVYHHRRQRAFVDGHRRLQPGANLNRELHPEGVPHPREVHLQLQHVLRHDRDEKPHRIGRSTDGAHTFVLISSVRNVGVNRRIMLDENVASCIQHPRSSLAPSSGIHI